MRTWRSAGRFILALLSIAGLVGLVGCGPQVRHQGADLSKLNEFTIEKNKTSEQELVAHFGPPMYTRSSGDGSKVLTWTDSRGTTQMNNAMFIPIVGGFAASQGTVKGTTQTRSLTATIRDGIIVDYSVTEGNNKFNY